MTNIDICNFLDLYFPISRIPTIYNWGHTYHWCHADNDNCINGPSLICSFPPLSLSKSSPLITLNANLWAFSSLSIYFYIDTSNDMYKCMYLLVYVLNLLAEIKSIKISEILLEIL